MPVDGDGGPSDGAADGGLARPVEIGTGAEAFEPLSDGQTLPIIAGPQGGFHLWAAARVREPIDPENLSLRFRVLLDGGTQSDNTWKLSLVQNGDAWEWFALTEVLSNPDAVRGKEVEFRLDVTDTAGRTASDARRIIPVGP